MQGNWVVSRAGSALPRSQDRNTRKSVSRGLTDSAIHTIGNEIEVNPLVFERNYSPQQRLRFALEELRETKAKLFQVEFEDHSTAQR